MQWKIFSRLPSTTFISPQLGKNSSLVRREFLPSQGAANVKCMEMWLCGEDVKNYWRVKRISNTFLVVYSVSVRKQMDCECMDVCICQHGCLGASAWTYAHRGRRRASIRGMVVQAQSRSRRSYFSFPSWLSIFSSYVVCLFFRCYSILLICFPFRSEKA